MPNLKNHPNYDDIQPSIRLCKLLLDCSEDYVLKEMQIGDKNKVDEYPAQGSMDALKYQELLKSLDGKIDWDYVMKKLNDSLQPDNLKFVKDVKDGIETVSLEEYGLTANGNIYVNSSLLPTDSDDPRVQLVKQSFMGFVLAHEMIHLIRDEFLGTSRTPTIKFKDENGYHWEIFMLNAILSVQLCYERSKIAWVIYTNVNDDVDSLDYKQRIAYESHFMFDLSYFISFLFCKNEKELRTKIENMKNYITPIPKIFDENICRGRGGTGARGGCGVRRLENFKLQ